jgi:pyridinium-3,5-biscarboxylic acid mononucleotide sulfurtransferase
MSDSMIRQLETVLARHDRLAVAVSGGVDSTTLGVVAHRARPGQVTVMHAVSAAVPPAATARVRAHAEREGWDLVVLDAGEFADARYVANPVDRCYFCKSNLYGRIRERTAAVIASGTNRDDLSDFRPGLKAADEIGVVHPYVEAGIGKAGIYAIAAALGLQDLAALPAQPCLASRVETGIAIDPDDMAFIGSLEETLAPFVAFGDPLRVRIRRAGVVVEMGQPAGVGAMERIAALAEAACAGEGRRFAGVGPYRRGSTFLRGSA